jgi:hypothetical protein
MKAALCDVFGDIGLILDNFKILPGMYNLFLNIIFYVD